MICNGHMIVSIYSRCRAESSNFNACWISCRYLNSITLIEVMLPVSFSRISFWITFCWTFSWFCIVSVNWFHFSQWKNQVLCYLSTRLFVHNGSLTRYAQVRVAHAPGMPGTFSSSPRVNDPDIHHGTCVIHMPWCMSRCTIRNFAYLVRGPWNSNEEVTLTGHAFHECWACIYWSHMALYTSLVILLISNKPDSSYITKDSWSIIVH